MRDLTLHEAADLFEDCEPRLEADDGRAVTGEAVYTMIAQLRTGGELVYQPQNGRLYRPARERRKLADLGWRIVQAWG